MNHSLILSPLKIFTHPGSNGHISLQERTLLFSRSTLLNIFLLKGSLFLLALFLIKSAGCDLLSNFNVAWI